MTQPSTDYRGRSYQKHIKNNQTFYGIVKTLSVLPSPKAQLFNLLLSQLQIKPAYLRMVLCSTASGKELGSRCKNKVASILQIPTDSLFPPERGAAGSLIHIYSNLESTSIEYLDFLNDLGAQTGASRGLVAKWASGKHKPSKSRQRIIAKLLDIPSSILFP